MVKNKEEKGIRKWIGGVAEKMDEKGRRKRARMHISIKNGRGRLEKGR